MPEGLQEVTVTALRMEADDVLAVELAPASPQESLPAWSPGAHIDVLLPNGLERQYSLCGPVDAPFWQIAVLHEPGRGGSTYVHRQLRPGELLTVRGPRNHFELEPGPSYVFIAGGIGITPLLPMMRALESRGAAWRLLYGGRTRSSMAYLDELEGYGPRVTIAPEDECGLLDIPTALAAADRDTAVYCCGPAGLIDATLTHTKALGLECRVERFTPLMDVATALSGDAFKVVLKRSGLTIDVGDGESILDQAEQAGVDLPFSCREGTCGSCETDVIEGAVDHRDGILTEDERRENRTMMICVSRAVGSRLVLDL